MDALIKTIHVPSKIVLSVVGSVVHGATIGVSERDQEPLGDVPELISGVCVSCFLFEVVRYQREKKTQHLPPLKKGGKII